MTAVGIVVGAVATVAIISMIGRQWPTTPAIPSPITSTNLTHSLSPREAVARRAPNTTQPTFEATETGTTEQGTLQRDIGESPPVSVGHKPGAENTAGRPAIAGSTLTNPAFRFRLTGVMLGGNQAVAIVNGTMVRVGQHVDGAEVLAVESTAVRLRKDGSDFELLLDLGSDR